MNEGQARELLLESGDGSLTAMRTSLVDDPKDTPGVVIGRASHDLLNQAIEGCDASGCFAAAKDASTMNVEGCDVSPGSATPIFMFNAHRTLRRGGQSLMLAPASWMLVFSSAEMTNSSFLRGLPFQERSYRSRIRLALTAKAGSRGKIQLLWYQGRMASSWSHRQMVLPEMVATKPALQT
jgi:hypothetical protein